jgi:hypothetical protein
MKTSDLFTEFRNPSIQYWMLPLFRVNDDVVQEENEWQVRANKRDGGHRPMAAAHILGQAIVDTWGN